MNLPNNNYRILVVDSSLIVAERLNALLKDLECVQLVSRAYSYKQALELLARETYEVVLLDSQLPDQSGFDLLAFIKKNYPEVKTIMLTNQSSVLYRNKGLQMGTDHFIDKSSEFESVAQIINNYAVGYQMN